jgi:hypothetical protein
VARKEFSNESQIKKLHLEIAELIEKMTDRYNHLLDSLQLQSDTE